MKKEDIVLVVFSALILFSIAMLLFQNSKIIGYVTEGTTVSNVTISKFLSIDMSTNLSTGIYFGNISTLPAVNINATNNYDGGSDESSMIVNLSTDSNIDVDFCIKANADLIDTGGGNTLVLANESYYNSTSTDISNPDLLKEISLTTSYVKSGEDIVVGNGTYYRFWLDIPANQPAGTYNNTITFKGVEAATACGA